MGVWRRWYDRLFPVICVGTYRSHCLHYEGMITKVVEGRRCLKVEDSFRIYECCRCKLRTETWQDPYER